jgi:hypothetical protein
MDYSEPQLRSTSQKDLRPFLFHIDNRPTFRPCFVEGFCGATVVGLFPLRISKGVPFVLSLSTPCSAPLHRSNAKIRFQSFFMLMTTQPCFLASAMSESLNVPIFDSAP